MAKVEDKNGFWFIEHNPITKTGVYDYLGKQISPECEPNKIYKVLRPKEELFKKETLDSLRLIPIVNDHTMIGTGFTAPEDKGIDGTLGDNVSHDTDTIYNDLKIMSNKMKEDIRNGKKELSLGYFCTYDKQAGTYKGQRYDYIQRNIKANHLALVDKGRMGADVRVYDSKNQGGMFAMDSIDITMDKDEDIEWITVKGTHIPIKKGATAEQKTKAIESFFEMQRATHKENTDPFNDESKRKKFEKLNAELHKKGGESKGIKGSSEKLFHKGEIVTPEQSEAQFKEDDFVKTPAGIGKISQIVRGKLSDTPYYKVTFEDGKTKTFLEEEIQPDTNKGESEKKENTPKLKLGDRVGFEEPQGVEYKFIGENRGQLQFENIDDDSDKVEFPAEALANKLRNKEIQIFGKQSEPEKAESGTKGQDSTDTEEYKNTQGEDSMAENKQEKPVLDEDKRKIIDEIGGILKGKVDDEVLRTILGKAEKLAYNASEAGKGTDEGEEVEEVIEEEGKEKEVKDKKKAAKDKCGKDKEEDEVEEEVVVNKKEEKKGMDENDVIKAIARKDRLARAVAKVIGTFDHSEMTEQQVAEYACDKLDLPVKKGEEITGINCFLKSQPKERVIFSYGMDSASKEDAEFEKFQKGE